MKETSVYEDIAAFYPPNVNTDDNVAYGDNAYSQKPVDTTCSQKTIPPDMTTST